MFNAPYKNELTIIIIIIIIIFHFRQGNGRHFLNLVHLHCGNLHINSHPTVTRAWHKM